MDYYKSPLREEGVFQEAGDGKKWLDWKYNLKEDPTEYVNGLYIVRRKVKNDSKICGLNKWMKEISLYQHRKYWGRDRLGDVEPRNQF